MSLNKFKPATSTADPVDVKARLIEFLREFDAETEEINQELKFAHAHNFQHETAFLREKRDDRGLIFIRLCNRVLGVHY